MKVNVINIAKYISYLGIMLLFACTIAPEDTQQKTTDFFAENGFGEGVALVQHPAGEYYKGVTYVAYQGPLEDPYVAAYNHKTQQWTGPFKAGSSVLGKDPKDKIDSHGKPTLIIDDDGYIHIFYGGHGGVRALHGHNPFGDYHSGENKHAVSARPYDISEWIDLDNVSPFGNYNQAVKMDNGDIYVFYRHGAHRSDWVYQKSTDNGRTFAAPVSFLKHQRRSDNLGSDSWYPYIAKGIGNQIVVGFDYHFCWDRSAPRNNRGGHSTERKNLYYMTLNTETNVLQSVDGQILTMPLTKEEADTKALVFNTGDQWTFNGTTKVDAKGNPHLSIHIGDDIGWQIGGPKYTRYFFWDGAQWKGNLNNGLPIARGDFWVEGNHVNFLLSGIDEATKATSVRWWHSTDAGYSFIKGDELLQFKDDWDTKPSNAYSQRPKSLSNLDSPGSSASSFIRNAHPDARIIIAEKAEGTDYRRMYLVGDNGPVVRSID